MLAMSEITPEDVTDAIGELVNMIGGNVKSLMPEPSILSLPMVAAGHIAVPSEATEVPRLDLLWHDEPLILRILSLANDTRRSEARRVGKESVSTRTSRRSPYTYKKKKH